MTKAGACVLLTVFAAACGVGDDTMNPDDPPIVPVDPNPNRIACSAAFTTQGTFTPGLPERPLDTPTGCWPVGTWTFTATLDNTAPVLDIDGDNEGDRCGMVSGTTAPTVAASYSFKVDRVDMDTDMPPDGIGDGWVESYTYMGNTTMHTVHKIKVTEGGGGDCEGGVELVSPDKKLYWNFKPTQEGTVLGGLGEFTAFIDPQPY